MLRIRISFFLIASILYFPSLSFCQNSTIDSLKLEIKNDHSYSPKKAKLFDDLAWEFIFSEPEKALIYADSSLYIAKKGHLKEEEGVALNTIGVAFLVNQVYDSALIYFNKSVIITDSLNLHLKAGASYSNIGIIYYELGNYDSALINQTKSLRFREKAKDTTEMVKSIINIGAIYDAKGKYYESIKNCLLAVNYLALNENTELLATCQGNIGAIYLQLSEYRKSLDYLIPAKKYFSANENNYKSAIVNNNLGEVYSNLGNHEKAIANFKESIEINDFDMRTKSYSLFGLGNSYSQIKEYDKAIQYYFMALELDKENRNLKEMASSYAAIGETFNEQKKFQLASQYLLKGYSIADSIGALPELVKINKLLVSNQLQIEGLKNIDNRFKNFNSLQDSLFSIEKIKKIGEIESKYQIRIKDDSIRHLNEKNILISSDYQKEKTISRLFSIMILVLLGLSGLLGYLFKLKRQQNQRLQSGNETLIKLNEELTTELEEKEKILLTPEVLSKKTITLTSNGKEVVQLGEIIYVQSQDKAVKVFTDLKTHWDWVSLKTYNEILPKELFLRVHRSYIINLLHIKNRTTRSITMSNGQIIKIGNTIRNDINDFFNRREIK